MNARTSLTKERVTLRAAKLHVSESSDGRPQISIQRSLRQDDGCRATRSVDDPSRFLVLSFSKSAEKYYLNQTTGQERLLRLLSRGLDDEGKRYVFLGYSESMLGAGNLMFFHEDANHRVKDLMRSFGDLDSVYVKHGYGKYAARFGLSFSSTAPAVNLEEADIVRISDRKAKDGSVTTDGVGLIRDSLAHEVCVKLNLAPDTAVFQSRVGGIKGVFVRYQDEDFERVSGSKTAKIAFRDSMFKYPGGPRILEINGVSKPPKAARLNVQFILLLLSLGVRMEAFQALLLAQLERIKDIFTNREAAISFLERNYNCSLDATATPSPGPYQDLFFMLHAGFDLSEPRVKWTLDFVQQKMYNRLKDKLSIDVPDSAYLYGVADETETINPGEVYVNMPGRGTLAGRKILVGKNPAYALGDLQFFTVVDSPRLRKSCPPNCIVFASSSYCVRSPTDMMSGGDLDGDEYWISWDATIMPAQTQPAQVRQRDPKPDINFPLSSKLNAAAEVFITLHNKMLLGQMSNQWLAIAESSVAIARDMRCIKLVPLIEKALDMTKMGDDVRKLRADFQAVRPGSNPQSSVKRKHLDALRDIVPQMPRPNGLEHFIPDPDLDVRRRGTSKADWDKETALAAHLMPRFNSQLAAALKDPEAEDVSLSQGSQEPGNDGRGKHEIERREREKQDRTNAMTEDFQREHFSGSTDAALQKLCVRASAWYYYGYSQKKQAFAWLGVRQLCRIKAVALTRGEVVSIGPLTTPLIPAPTTASPRLISSADAAQEPSELELDAWLVVRRTNSDESLLVPSAPAPAKVSSLLEIVSDCITKGHDYTLRGDAARRKFRCKTCYLQHEEKVES